MSLGPREHLSKHDREIAAIRKLVLTGMKMLNNLASRSAKPTGSYSCSCVPCSVAETVTLAARLGSGGAGPTCVRRPHAGQLQADPHERLLHRQLFHILKGMKVHFTAEQEAQLARIATKSGTDPEHLVKDAALRLLEEEGRFRASVREGIAQADRGEFLEEEMDARFERMLLSE